MLSIKPLYYMHRQQFAVKNNQIHRRVPKKELTRYIRRLFIILYRPMECWNTKSTMSKTIDWHDFFFKLHDTFRQDNLNHTQPTVSTTL